MPLPIAREPAEAARDAEPVRGRLDDESDTLMLQEALEYILWRMFV